jgi:hypothetical protein
MMAGLGWLGPWVLSTKNRGRAMFMLTRLLVAAAVTVSAASAWGYASCPLGGGIAGGGGAFGGSIQVKGTYYDAAGNATKVECNDPKAGDTIIVSTEGASPPTLMFELVPINPTGTCALLAGMLLPTFGPYGTEVQVVKNGVPKRQCVFHGATTDGVSSWVAHTVRKFNHAGQPTSEQGPFTLNSEDGRIFIGKIKIKYP